MLLGVQAAMVFLLLATLLLICFVNSGQRLVLYATLVGVLAAVSLLAFFVNLKGRYKASAWLTTLVIALGPWGSLLLDGAVARGDFFPLFYIALSILLCAVLLSEIATVVTTFFQMAALTVFVVRNDGMHTLNWPSLLAFIFFSAVFGVIISHISRKQFDQIQKQNEQLREHEE